ncbi:MAG: putative metal-binding motif-containing protein, partial [Myxococcota bacterium]
MSRILPVLSIFSLSCSGDPGFTEFNTPPAASITQPADGSVYDEGESITFFGIVDDSQQSADELDLSWVSDIDGLLSEAPADANGDALLVTANLSPGNHVITLRVVDDNASSGTDWVEVTINDLEEAPEITLISPLDDEDGVEEEPFTFEVVVSDAQDDPQDLLVQVYDEEYGEICADFADAGGRFTCTQLLPPGDYVLFFVVTDLEGYASQVSQPFIVVPLDEIDNDADGFTEVEGDCDDTDPSTYPGAEEVYNDIDDDCDEITDEGTVGYDDDSDGQTELDGDCDDADDETFRDAEELPDGRDNDCDGTIDEGTVAFDDDSDGFTELDGDCDDNNNLTYPDADEIPDSNDNDCDGTIDEGTSQYDDDGDCFCEDDPCNGSIDATCGALDVGDCDDLNDEISPDATEVCDDDDNDCDGVVDEDDAADAQTWYADGDNDAYGDPADTLVQCDAPTGYVL